jgi:decaprenylphospho-beta-D-erythro-pentofuranosid-2-ulose 2-reductase
VNDAMGAPQSLLVLGGTSEIGLATARALARRRLRSVVLAARRPEELEQPMEELRQLGVEDVQAVHFDATDTASHAGFVEDVFDRLGEVDVVLLCFGVLGDQKQLEEDHRAAVELIETNFVGAASVGLLVGQRLRQQGHGVLVALSSVAAERARRSNFVYGSSKAGLDALFQGLGDSLAGTGARVLVVRPGFVHTRMTAGLPAPPLSTTPEAVAEVIVRALETGAEQAWAPPALRYVMSGLRHLPRPVFRRLKI